MSNPVTTGCALCRNGDVPDDGWHVDDHGIVPCTNSVRKDSLHDVPVIKESLTTHGDRGVSPDAKQLVSGAARRHAELPGAYSDMEKTLTSIASELLTKLEAQAAIIASEPSRILAAVEGEREACAKEAEDSPFYGNEAIAEAIRSRRNGGG